jgi:GTP cyclohydrolase III
MSYFDFLLFSTGGIEETAHAKFIDGIRSYEARQVEKCFIQ